MHNNILLLLYLKIYIIYIICANKKSINFNAIIIMIMYNNNHRFNSLVPMYTRGADAVVLVYDITRKETFKHVRSWLDIIDVRKILRNIRVSYLE